MNGLKTQKERNSMMTSTADIAFHACLADNNKIRTKFGLDPVSASKFSGKEGYEENRSLISYSRAEDVFFDAENGAAEDSDESSGNYSVQNALIIVDDSDEGSRMSSIQAINISHNSNQKDSNSLQTNSSHHSSNAPQTSLENPRKDSGSIIRRSSLPAPSESTENISIMGILRNNVISCIVFIC